jgi:tRNA 2-selenouridine synthase
VVEAESSKVGECRLPPMLWKAMQAAPRVALQAPLHQRAAYLTRAYGDLAADRARLEQVVGKLRPAHPAEVIELWLAQVRDGALPDLAEGLMARHYDPRYARHRARMAAPLVELEAPELSAAALPGLAGRVAEAVARLSGIDVKAR